MTKRAPLTGRPFHTYYSRLLLYFVAVSASCVLILGLLLSVFFFYKLNKANASYNEALLNNAQLEVQKTLEFVQANVYQLGIQKLVTKYLNPYAKIDYMEINDIIQSLADLVGANDFLDSVYVVYPQHNMTIASHGVYSENMFIDREWIAHAETTEKRFIWFAQREVRHDILSSGSSRVVTLVGKLPLYRAYHSGYIVVNIKESFLANKLSSVQHNDIHLIIESDQGGLVSMSNNTSLDQYNSMFQNLPSNSPSSSLIVRNGTYFIVTQARLDLSGWRFLACTPLNSFMQDYIVSTAMIIGVVLLVICISFIIASYLRQKMYQPIEQLIQNIRNPLFTDQHHEYTEFRQISANLIHITKERESLNQRIQQVLPSLQDKFLNELIQGHLMDAKMIDEYLGLLNLPLAQYGRFAVISLSLDEALSLRKEERVLYLMAVRNQFETAARSLELLCYGVEQDIRTVSFIIGFADHTPLNQTLAQLGETILEYARETFQFTVTLGVGNPVENLTFLQVSANQAEEALEKSFIYGHNQIIYFRTIEKDSAGAYINPLTFEKPLTNAIRSYNLDEMNHVLSDIYQLICQNLYDIRLIRQFYLSVINIIFIMEHDLSQDPEASSYRLNQLVDQVYRQSSLSEIHHLTQQLCISISERAEAQRTDKTQQLVDDILRYLEQNYSSDISLDDLAGRVSYTPTYINKILRASCHKTFYDILTDIRTQKACELLAGTELQIYQIAEQVGYNNVQSFIRMFKKEVALTPGAYREKMQTG